MTIDLSFLENLTSGLPVLDTLGPEARGVVIVGVIVQLLLAGFRMAFTGSRTKEAKAEHWFNKTMVRVGPLVNAAMGLGIAAISTIPMEMGLIGGMVSQWTYAAFNKTAKPAVMATASKIKAAVPGSSG